MIFLVCAAVVLSSESLRHLLETTFASFSVIVFDHVVGILAAVAFLSVLCTLSALRQSKKGEPPVVSSLLPYIGNFIQFAKFPLGFVEQSYRKYGNCFTASMFGQKLTFLIGPDAHIPFFRENDSMLGQAEVYRFMTPVFGNGVVYDATPKRRAQQMQFMAGGLRVSRMKSYVDKISMETEMYFASWKNEGTVSLKQIFSELTILTASRALMGDEVRENLFAQVSKLYHDLDGGTTPLSFFFPYLPTPAHRRRNAARDEMKKLFSTVIRKRRESGVKKDDILQTFMDSCYKDTPGEFIPDDHVVGLLIALLFAGQHTSSITLTWTLMHLLKSPEILKRVIEECDSARTNEGKYTYEALSEMPLLHSCMKEVLRLHPPLIFLMRQVLNDVMLDKTTIPKGHIVVVTPAVAGRLEECWSNPNEFDPDRFLDDRKEESRKHFTYIAFGGGMHGCMGQQYAYLQVKSILGVLLRDFELELCEPELPPADYTAMVVGPLGDCMARFKRIRPLKS